MLLRLLATLSSLGLLIACGAPPVRESPHVPSRSSQSAASSAIVSESIEYKAGDATLEGDIARPERVTDKRPGVVVFHDWMGLGPTPKKRADELAILGYIALAADIYGRECARPKRVKPANSQRSTRKETDPSSGRALEQRSTRSSQRARSTPRRSPRSVTASSTSRH
ncbi:MAG TPA: dienelactone hydrolase family protein [Labilithrix sp.]|nr:dienelactone hydrolase family protein [Labilithrix sp.]